MASIVTAVLKATVGLILNKGRELAADKLQEGDVTEQQFRNMLVREIDDVKSKLDGLARKDLLTSISIIKEGIVFLYKVLDMKFSCKKGKTKTKQRAVTQGSRKGTTQLSWQSFGTDVGKFSLLRGMESLDDSGKRALADAKKRFDEARVKATEAFNNVALSTSDRIMAMQYRVMSTILEKIDNPKEAIPACKLCLEELHSMPTVNKSFKVQTTGGFLSLFNKKERAQIIQSVYDVNTVVLQVTKVADGVLSRELDAWPGEKNYPRIRYLLQSARGYKYLTVEAKEVIPEAISKEPKKAIPEAISKEPKKAIPEAISKEPKKAIPEAISKEPKKAIPEAISKEPKKAIPVAISKEPKKAIPVAISKEPKKAIPVAISKEPKKAIPVAISKEPKKAIPVAISKEPKKAIPVAISKESILEAISKEPRKAIPALKLPLEQLHSMPANKMSIRPTGFL